MAEAAVASFLSRTSKVKPVLVVLDDLHCADEPSLQLLTFVARQLARSSVLIAGTYRDTELRRGHPLQNILADLGRVEAFQRVPIRGLLETEIAQYVELVAGEPVEHRLLDAVCRQTEGNPLFMKELVRLLERNGALRDPRCLDSGRGLEIPDGVREMIGIRLDRLSGPTNRVLRLASIIGAVFSQAELGQLTDDSIDVELADSLEEALDEGILVDAREPGTYQFHHALAREVLYDEYTSIRRSQLHFKFAQALEQAYGDNLAPYLSRLADHYLAADQAGAAEKAIEYATSAGHRAMDMLAFEDAARHFGNALQSLALVETTKPRERLELLQSLAEAQMASHDPACSRTLRVVFDTAVREGIIDLCVRAALLAENAAFWAGLSNPRVVPMLQQALCGMEEGSSTLRSRLLASLARSKLYMQLFKEADKFSRVAVEVAREAADPSTLSFALSVRLLVMWGPSTADERLAYATEMLEMAQMVGDRNQASGAFFAPANSHSYLLVIHMERGDREAYLKHLHECAAPTNSRLPFLGWAVPAILKVAAWQGILG